MTEVKNVRWIRREDHLAGEIDRLTKAMERGDERYDELRKELYDLKLAVPKSIDNLMAQLIETKAKLAVQTKYSILMVVTIIPANMALLWKIFSV